ncbi:MAG: DUF1972 domain-containing protein [Cytophagales bacterium]
MKTTLKIGILGSRGIPNSYGGFEQFAESLALYLAEKGHVVSVYNSSLHPNKEKIWKGINIIPRFDPENKIGTAGQFIYDLNCILHSRKSKFDIVLQLGYTSSAIWNFLFSKNSLIVTNMDGLEWKRSKYSKPVQKFLKWSERMAAKSSDHLVSDSIGIQEHLKSELNKDSTYIPYGASVFKNADKSVLGEYQLVSEKYYLLIARMEPENNIETILEGYCQSKSELPFIVIGSIDKSYGAYIKKRFNKKSIHFLGAVYNQEILNNLRYFSKMYFHGHSVGGTNPSLLEAMASSALICAHDNIFNKSILGKDALYFQSESDISSGINNNAFDRKTMLDNNLAKIREKFNEPEINSRYEKLFLSLCN